MGRLATETANQGVTVKWFRISLIQSDMSVAQPDGQPAVLTPVRAPSSNGKVHYPPGSYRLYARGKDSAFFDAIIGLGTESAGTIPSDWAPLTVDEAKQAFRYIVGREPLESQVF